MGSRHRISLRILPILVAAYMAACAGAVRPTAVPQGVSISALWERPDNLPNRDLFYGAWGRAHAPDPHADYTFERPKSGGINPGMIVRDPQGREWSVKQAPEHSTRGNEGPVEVVLSRVLSAVGYHQPPVYFLPSFTLRDGSAAHVEPGGRFRLNDPSMMDRGEWSWQQNPFVGQRPYQGLLAILMLFNSTDLKNSNNTLYDVAIGGRAVQWYVVRDLGAALGETGRIGPKRGYPDLFAGDRFISGVRSGFVEFDYSGFHKELLRDRITPDDVRWACDLLAGLSDAQWQDAFRAGGYSRDVASHFITTVHARIAQGQHIGDNNTSRRSVSK